MTFKLRAVPKPEPTPKKKRKRIKFRSVKRAAQEVEYRILSDQYLKDHPECEVCKANKSECVHHKKGRTGDLLTDVRHFLAVDGFCHDEIENNPTWAKKMGYSLDRL